MSEVSTAVDSAGPVVPENGEDDSVAAQEVEGVSLSEAGGGSGGRQGEAAGEEEARDEVLSGDSVTATEGTEMDVDALRTKSAPATDEAPAPEGGVAVDLDGSGKKEAGTSNDVDIAKRRERDATAMPSSDLLLTPTALTRPAVKSATTHELRIELGSDGLTEALLGPLSGRSTTSSRARRSRHRLGPIKQGTKSYLATSIVPLLIEGLTQMSIVRPVASLSTMGPSAWLAQFILERSPQRTQYEIRRKDAGVHIRTQTQFDPEFPPLPRQVEVEVQTRLKGRDIEASGTAAGSGVSAIRNKMGAGAAGPGLIAQLKELSELVQMGILTQSEFVAAKSLLFRDAGLNINQQGLGVVEEHKQEQQPMPLADRSFRKQESPSHTTTQNVAGTDKFNGEPLLGRERDDVDEMVIEKAILAKNKSPSADIPPKAISMTTAEEATGSAPLTPASESEDIDSMLRPVFTALDRKGSGALSALDMLHEIPQVSASPAFQRAAQSLPRLQKLARPGSFRMEVQNMIGWGAGGDDLHARKDAVGFVEQRVDLERFSSWAKDRQERGSPGSSLVNADGEKRGKESVGAEEDTREKDALVADKPIDGSSDAEGAAVELETGEANDDDIDVTETTVAVAPAAEEATSSSKSESEDAPASSAPDLENIEPNDPPIEEAADSAQDKAQEKEDRKKDPLVQEEESSQPADPASQQRLAFRSKRRLLRDRALRSLFDAFDIGDTGMLEKTEILRAMVSNQRVTGLLAYHTELERLAHPKTFGATFKAMDTDSSDSVSWTEFKAFCTAVISDDEGQDDKEDDTTISRILTRAALEKEQHVVLKKLYDLVSSSDDAKNSAVGKDALCRAIQKGGNDAVRALVLESPSISYMRFVKRYEPSLTAFPVSKQGFISYAELSAFVGSMTQETMDDEGILFGEPKPDVGEEGDDY